MAPGRSPAVSGRRRRRGLRWSAPTKQRPQLPRSPSSPEPPPAGAVGDPAVLPPGTDVEVRVDSDGFYGTWYRATVGDFAPVRGRGYPARYTVTYADLVDANGGGTLAEPFAPTHVRPRPPPPPESPPRFLPDDAVEAFHNSGWWSGIVVSADPASVTVAFPISREVIPFPPHLVRPRRDYVGGGVWAPSRRVIAVRPKAAVRVYEAGEDVEVGVDRELYGYSWVPATVVKVIDDLSYVVEYSDVEQEGGGSGAEKRTEYLHWQFIRPAVERSPQDCNFRLEPGAAVEVYCEGAWSAGVVRGIVGDGEFEVSINGNKESQLVTKVEFLKPHYKWEDGKHWRSLNAKRQADFRRSSGSGKRSRLNKVTFSDEEQTHDYSGAKKSMIELQQNETLLAENDGQASVSKTGTTLSPLEISRPSIYHQNSCSLLDGHSTAPKFHACDDNLQNQLGRKNKIRKVYTSKKVSKEREWLEQPHSLHSSLESPCTGQKIGVNEVTGLQIESSMIIQLEIAESTQMLLERTVEDTMDANELTYQEPVAMISLSSESAYNDIDTHGNKLDEVLTAPSSGFQENRDADELRHSTGTQVPFDKMPELWSVLEEKDVFKEFPQQPHFLPLQECLPELREAKALKLMMSFYHIVESTRKSSITDNEESFEGKKRALAKLKPRGFDVHHIESLLDEVIKVKFEHGKHLEEKITVEAQKQCTINSLSRKDLLLCQNDAAMAEREQKVEHLRQEIEHLLQEGQMIEQEKEDDEENLSELNVVEIRVNKALDADEEQFHAIMARRLGTLLI